MSNQEAGYKGYKSFAHYYCDNRHSFMLPSDIKREEEEGQCYRYIDGVRVPVDRPESNT